MQGSRSFRFLTPHVGALVALACSGHPAEEGGPSAALGPPTGAAGTGSAAGGTSGGGVSVVNGGTSGVAQAVVGGPLLVSTRAKPMSGGTLVVTTADLAIAADADRDQVFLADLGAGSVRSVPLEAGAEPGRVAEGNPGTAYVLLRGAGALALLDTEAGSVTARVPVCAAPRGVAFDASRNAVYVACRSGRLLTLDGASLTVTRTLDLEPDLRDVVVTPGGLFVTRFLSAELLLVSQDGVVTLRDSGDVDPGCGSPTVAYRAASDDQGHVVVAHQASSNQTVGVSSGAYGSSCSGGGLVTAAVTLTTPDDVAPRTPLASSSADPLDSPQHAFAVSTELLTGITPPYDVAFDHAGTRLAFLAASNDHASPLLRINAVVDGDQLGFGSWLPQDVTGQPVAVAFDTTSRWVVQLREPAMLLLEGGATLSLSADSVADTGQALFHVDAGLGVACASCHPEGDDDGHVWHFAAGLRRTQPLPGGVLGRAPFHWTGELPALSDLVGEVMVKRMGLGVTPAADQVHALGAFLDRIPARRVIEAVDEEKAARGEALFADATVGCATCHLGTELTDNRAHDVGTGGPFMTPTLIGVGFRSPLFHDGCAQTLSGRFGVCGGGDLHGKTSGLSGDQAADLVEYLKTL